MFNLESILGNLTGGKADPQAVQEAASEHVSSMDSGELSDHLETAAERAEQNGQPGMASQIQSLISQHGGNPDALKSAAVEYIKNNPKVLTQFAPSFAKGILGRFGL